MKVFSKDKALIKAWVDEVPVEDQAMEQLYRTASMPFIHKWLAVMPDVHWGMGATIGSVVATKGAIIPSCVGVDLGCGIMASLTDLTANDLPDNLLGARTHIEGRIPHGRTKNGGLGDVGAWRYRHEPDEVLRAWDRLEDRWEHIAAKYPKLSQRVNSLNHLGTLGTGNHFIEVCLDEQDRVWVMLHSGSRGVGARIGMHFISLAKKDMERWFIHLPDKDLAYFPEGSEHFDDYCEAVVWAQDFARVNRELMMKRALDGLYTSLGLQYQEVVKTAVNCHHNYVAKENHYGKNVLVTRKGAVRAREGDLGIIPGSMGTRSYIVRGKGNPEAFHSCSHGAGRLMSRTEAKRRFTVEDHIAATEGVECRKDEDVIDETPMAYKSIDAVMESQKDLVEIVHTLKQVICVKG